MNPNKFCIKKPGFLIIKVSTKLTKGLKMGKEILSMGGNGAVPIGIPFP